MEVIFADAEKQVLSSLTEEQREMLKALLERVSAAFPE